MSLIAQERETYTEVFQTIEMYQNFSPGVDYLPAFLEMSGAAPGATVLDAGCGTGKGGLALAAQGFDVTLLDLTDEGLTPEARELPFLCGSLWHPVAPQRYFDYTYACDVLEHVPTAFTMLVAHNIIQAARYGAFFSIALVPDSFGVWVGKPLHQTVQAFSWWRDCLNEIGTVRECRDLLKSGLYWVTPR